MQLADPAWLQEEDPDDADDDPYCRECGWPSPDRDGLCRACVQEFDDDDADVARWEDEVIT